MKQEIEIKEILTQIQQAEGEGFECDEQAVWENYQKNHANQSSLSIKILSIFGGLMATSSFLGFLLITGLYDSEMGMAIFGTIFIVGSVWVNLAQQKLLIDSASIAAFVVGFGLLGFGLEGLDVDDNLTLVLLIFIAFCSLILSESYILAFISVLIISGLVFLLFAINELFDIIHVYSIPMALLMAFWYLNEANLIANSPKLSKLYYPVRIGLVFSLIGGLSLLGIRGIVEIRFVWLASVATISVTLYLIYQVLQILKIEQLSYQITILAISLLVLLPTALSPAISGAIMIILLCYRVNDRTGLAIGVLAFIYFISQYYYDLNFTLLTKSIMLFSSGILFLIGYWFVHKKLG
jgi:uncharacterized membrane protein